MHDSLDKKLLDAVEHHDIDLAASLIRHGADVNKASSNGWTPLMLAILMGFFDMAKLLLTNGADPNLTTASQENPRRSPLAVAIRNGRIKIVELLVRHNVDANAILEGQLVAVDLARKLAERPFHQEEIFKIISLLDNYVLL